MEGPFLMEILISEMAVSLFIVVINSISDVFFYYKQAEVGGKITPLPNSESARIMPEHLT